MANKVPWHVTTDWKSITGVLMTLGLIVGLILFARLPEIVKEDRLKTYTGEAIGKITNVKKNMSLIQSEYGNKLHLSSFTINYSFELNGTAYNNENRLKATPVNELGLIKILKNDSTGLRIRYNKANPQKSLIAWE